MPRLSKPLTFGPSLVDWQDRIDVGRMRQARMRKMQAVMKRRGVAALLASGADDCRYLTGLKGADFAPQLWYVLFFAESDPVVFAHAGFHVQLPEEVSWIHEWRLARAWLTGICGAGAAEEEAEKFAADIARELSAKGLSGEPLAVIGIDGLGREALSKKGIATKGGSDMMLEASATKTPDEINCLKMAAVVAEAAWYSAVEALRPGVYEDELTRIMLDAAYRAGAESARAGFRSGPMTFERGLKGSSRIIEHGDLLYGNLCGTSFLGYRCCLYRTFSLGKASQKAEDWHRRLVDRMDAVIDAIRPGATTADAAAHFPPAETWGYGDEAEVLTIEIGHGVGIHQYEIPVINRQWSLDHPQTFEPGMVIAVEGREGAFNEGGVRIEDMVVVTDKGCEIIDHFPREIVSVDWM